MSGKDVASLVLRAAVGGTMVAHGLRHGRTLEGTAGWFGSIGFRQPRLQATASAVVEVGVGTGAIEIVVAAEPYVDMTHARKFLASIV